MADSHKRASTYAGGMVYALVVNVFLEGLIIIFFDSRSFAQTYYDKNGLEKTSLSLRHENVKSA